MSAFLPLASVQFKLMLKKNKRMVFVAFDNRMILEFTVHNTVVFILFILAMAAFALKYKVS